MTDIQDTTATGSAVSDKHFGKAPAILTDKLAGMGKVDEINRTKESLKKMVGDLDLDMDELEMLDPDGINGIFDDDVQAEE